MYDILVRSFRGTAQLEITIAPIPDIGRLDGRRGETDLSPFPPPPTNTTKGFRGWGRERDEGRYQNRQADPPSELAPAISVRK